MTNAAYRAMRRGKESETPSDEVWDEVKETTAKHEWDVEQMLDDDEDLQQRRASDD